MINPPLNTFSTDNSFNQRMCLQTLMTLDEISYLIPPVIKDQEITDMYQILQMTKNCKVANDPFAFNTEDLSSKET